MAYSVLLIALSDEFRLVVNDHGKWQKVVIRLIDLPFIVR